MSINAPVNFLQLGRYGKYGEQRYRQQFEGDFDSFNFNAALIREYCGTRRAIAFDPSYIPKSGRSTEGVGWFLVEFLKQGKITSSKVYFSIEIQMQATEILEMYQMYFQIEFMYWDADNIQA